MLANGEYDVPPGKLATVVTYLEMREPAAARDSVVPDGVTLVRKPKPELDWYRDLFNRVGGTDWLWFSRLLMTDETLAGVLHNPGLRIWALEKNGRAEGLLELDFRKSRECELAFFGVTGDLIGTGAGRYLMNEALRLAWAEPIERLHVHTCTLDHPDALGFYIRSGFTALRQQVEIADDPRVSGAFALTAGPRIPIFE